ncbi:MAG: NAD(P)-binding domain-containing protein [Parvibaculaceae bacterium]|nr:NAD(P)-binding domain-containing protein [Parvibaculaceae bacterium]
MKIGILGAATVGLTLATKFAVAGNDVVIANSRGPESLAAAIAEAGSGARAATVAQAVACDVVFLAVPWLKVPDVLTPDIAWDGRVLVDVTNIFESTAPNYRVADLKGDSGSEIVARLAPGAKVVKAFNTLPFKVIFAPTPANLKRVLFVAGDDGEAVSTVSSLIGELGLHPVALGSNAVAGRLMELGGPLSSLELLTPAQGASS